MLNLFQHPRKSMTNAYSTRQSEPVEDLNTMHFFLVS